MILAISLGVIIIIVAMGISVAIHIIITAVRSRAKKRHTENQDSTVTNMNRAIVATEAPIIYEDLDKVNKDIDLENNMAYSTAQVQPK